MAKYSGESELVYCNHCHSYKEFQYCEDEVVSEIPCKCKPLKINKELLDKFVEHFNEQYNKKQGVKNEKSIPKNK